MCILQVHRVGRTGRAGNRGIAYTFVNSGDEAKFAPHLVRAMIDAGQAENISAELRALSDSFKERVKKGEARWAGSGFKGKGFSYDSSELNDAQKLARLEKRQALIEAGMIDPDDDDPASGASIPKEGQDMSANDGIGHTLERAEKAPGAMADLQAKLSALPTEVLALPGMKEALMRKAGISMSDEQEDTSDVSSGRTVSKNANHFVAELEINDYPREARWKVTQKETQKNLQDEYQTAVTIKGQYVAPNSNPAEGERKLYLHLESASELALQNCIHEIRRLLNEETLRVSSRGMGGHRYSVV